ncbi:hypothetical protein K435DRAFT_781339, partial [Dendrothele bispora CBS 962.96]
RKQVIPSQVPSCRPDLSLPSLLSLLNPNLKFCRTTLSSSPSTDISYSLQLMHLPKPSPSLSS